VGPAPGVGGAGGLGALWLDGTKVGDVETQPVCEGATLWWQQRQQQHWPSPQPTLLE
jgi:hypothetical protein